MNRIYKSVWNAVTRSWTAVSEWQKARGKKSKSLQQAFFILPLSAVVFSYPVQASDFNNDSVIIGNNNTALTGECQFDAHLIGNKNNNIAFSLSENISIDQITNGVEGLFSLSNHGFEQTLQNGNVGYSGYATPNFSYNGSLTLNTTINQNGYGAAKLSFAAGEVAFNFFKNNLSAFNVKENSAKLTFINGTGAEYESNGLSVAEGSHDGYVKAMTLLTEIELLDDRQNQALDLDISDIQKEQTLSAKLTGTGNIRYKGSGINSSVLNIDSVIEKNTDGSEYNNANLYSGTTFVENLTLNLIKDYSLGQTTNLVVNSGLLNVMNNSETVKGNATFNGSSLLKITDGNRLKIEGNANFYQNAKIQSNGDSTYDSGLTVVGTLNIYSVNNNDSLSGVITASSAVLSNTEALGAAGLHLSGTGDGKVLLNIGLPNNPEAPQPGQEMVFDNTITSDISQASVEIRNALKDRVNVKYSDQTIDVDKTILNSNLSLTVSGTDQLGSEVALNGEGLDKNSILVINKPANTTSGWSLNGIKFTSSNNEDVIELNGSDLLPVKDIFNDYHGWVRLGQDLEITFADDLQSYLGNYAGLSLGKGSKLNISGDKTVSLNRFGWSAANGGGGQLDLTQFDFQTGLPAMRVEKEFELRGEGSIILDPHDVLTSVVTRQGNILDLDNTSEFTKDNSYLLISLGQEAQTDPSSADAEGIEIEYDSDSQVLNQTKFKAENGVKEVATGTWDYEAQKASDGLYLTYNLKILNIDNNDKDTALALNVTDDSDNELSAQLTGAGYVKVKKQGQTEDTFKISGLNNTFAGTMDVQGGLTVDASAGALGVGQVDLILGDDTSASNLNLIARTDAEMTTQVLSGLKTSSTGTTNINLDSRTTLDLALDVAETWQSTTLKGSGDFKLGKGELTVDKAQNLFTDFKGKVLVDGDLNLVADESSSNSTVDFGAGLSGKGTVALKNIGTNVQTNFDGTYQLEDNSTLIFDSSEDMPIAGNVRIENTANGFAKLVFDNVGESASAKVPSIVLASDDSKPSFELENSDITLNWNDVKTENGSSFDVSSEVTLFDTILSSESTFRNEITNTADQAYSVDLEKVVAGSDGIGHIWLNFENAVSDLKLTATNDQNGLKVGFTNAKLNLSQNNSDVADNLRLHLGDGSTLQTQGQVTLQQGLTLDAGSTLDFTYGPDSFNPSGTLSANGIILGTTDSAGELVVTGSTVNVTFDSVKIDTSLTDGVDQNPLLNYLDVESENSVVDIVQNIDLSNGNASDIMRQIASAMTVQNSNGEKISKAAVSQNGKQVATLYSGLGVIGKVEDNGTGTLGIGGKVTRLDLLDGYTTVLDIASATPDASMSVQVTGTGNLLFMNGDQNSTVTVAGANSTFTGQTVITDGAKVKLINNNGLSENSTLIQVGGSVQDVATNSDSGTLLFETNNVNLDQHTKQLIVHENGTVDLNSANQSTSHYSHIHISGNEGSVIDGNLKGNAYSAIYVEEGSKLDITNAVIDEFKGTFNGSDDAKLIYNFKDNATWTANTAFKDNSALVLNGEGTITVENYSNGGLSVDAGSGRVLFAKTNTRSNDAYLNKLSIGKDATVAMDGVLTVQDLVGNGGVVEMNVALGNADNGSELGANGNDGIRVANSATGAVSLLVNDRNQLQNGEKEKVKLIEVKGDATSFAPSLISKDGQMLSAITAGAYDYTLQTEKGSDGTGTDYLLSSVLNSSGDHSGTDTDQVRQTTVTAGSYIGIAYAAQLFDVSLHDRVGNRDWINPVTGEKQSTSLWMRHSMSHERFRDSTSQLRMRSTSNVTMLGGDLVQYTTDGDGFAYAGLMGGYGTMDTKTRSKVTDLRSKSETDAWGVGAYAGWKANKDGQTGPYVDGWLMFTHASSDVTGVDRQEENIKGEGLSASIEAGWGFKLGSVETSNGKYATFTVEPHASVTWFGMEYDDLHTDAQDVKFEGKNNVRTRLGTRVNMTEEGNKTFNAFAEANWVHNTQEYGATISGLTVDQTGSRNQAEGRIGVDWRITKDLSAWARVGASFGSDNYSEREGSIGVRYQF